MANPALLKLLKRGVKIWNKWRLENPDAEIDLSKADLQETDLTGINLYKANLESANLYRANLDEANLEKANLKKANLEHASLVKAILTGTNFDGANLKNAANSVVNGGESKLKKVRPTPKKVLPKAKDALKKLKSAIKARQPIPKSKIAIPKKNDSNDSLAAPKAMKPKSSSKKGGFYDWSPNDGGATWKKTGSTAKTAKPVEKNALTKAKTGLTGSKVVGPKSKQAVPKSKISMVKKSMPWLPIPAGKKAAAKKSAATPKKARAKSASKARVIGKNNGSGTAKPLKKAAENDLDLVRCSVFAPAESLPGKNIMVQVFAHLNEEEEKVKNMASNFDESSKPRGTRQLDDKIKRGSRLTFTLAIKGVEIDETVQTLVWRGQAESVQFGVFIPVNHEIDNIIATVYVCQDSVPFGQVKFSLKINPATNVSNDNNQVQETTGTWKRYRYAFISYASADRQEVLKRVQMLPRAHIDFFQDLLTLEPGERWGKALYKHIDKSDVFFLFWSSAAKRSKWVKKEVEYAMQLNEDLPAGGPEIIPVIIEGPPPVAPPPALKHIHFNDTFIYFINAS